MTTKLMTAHSTYAARFLHVVAVAAVVLGTLLPSGIRAEPPSGGDASRAEQVLFAFDDHALPFQQGVRLKLMSYRSSGEQGSDNIAIPVGPPGSADGRGVIYYGTVVESERRAMDVGISAMGDQDEGRHYRICLAKSKDGKVWEKPDLGAVEYGGNRHNNLVDSGSREARGRRLRRLL